MDVSLLVKHNAAVRQNLKTFTQTIVVLADLRLTLLLRFAIC